MLGVSFIHQAHRQARSQARSYRDQVNLTRFVGRATEQTHWSQRDADLLAELEGRIVRGDYRPSDRHCPISGEPYVLVHVDGVDVDVALQSRSIWFDAGELQHFTGLDREVPGVRLASRPSRWSCPTCGGPMRTYQFLAPHNLLVDACIEGHGVLFEEGGFARALAIS